jgi:methyl-accepting chemotaxis protein
MKLKTIFLALGASTVALSLFSAGMNYWVSDHLMGDIKVQSKIATITQRHMEGDMMHDAINGDVLSAQVAFLQNNAEGIKAAAESLKANAGNFHENLEANAAETLPDDIKPLMSEAQEALNEYESGAETTINLYSRGDSAEGAIADFQARFERMEKENEALANAILAWSEAEAKASAAMKNYVYMADFSAILSVIAALATLFVALNVIFKSINQVSDSLGRMARGEATDLVNLTKRKDEIGDMGRALSELGSKLGQAFQLKQMVDALPTPIMTVNVHDNLKVQYNNGASNQLLNRLRPLMPAIPHDVNGVSIDIFHKNPEHQRRLLADPSNLPHRARITVGSEKISLLVAPIFDAQGRYSAASLVWDVVTAEDQLTRDFEDKVQAVVARVADQANQLQDISASMTDDIARSQSLAVSASSASSQTHANVATVAAAVEELNHSVSEITHQILKTNDLVRISAQRVQNADVLAQKLAHSSDRINEVTTVISEISSQINLLALNATIESARAGEAGRGFAVVAGEVKNLANQTGKSIVEINSVIDEMRQASGAITTALTEVRESVDAILEAATSVSSAAEEQSATTQEIAKNMSFAAKGAQVISTNLEQVSQATSQSENAATHLRAQSGALNQDVSILNHQVQDFLYKLNQSKKSA